MVKKRKRKKPSGDMTNLEYGRKLHAEGVARRMELVRQKAIKAGKELLGRKIVL